MDDKTHPKYKNFAEEVTGVLESFESAKEWPDLIKCLQKLQKVFMKHNNIPIIPCKEFLSKRLAQCLNTALPSGVHLKTLDIYDSILQKILFVYESNKEVRIFFA